MVSKAQVLNISAPVLGRGDDGMRADKIDNSTYYVYSNYRT